MSVFQEPQCLIFTDPTSGKLRLDDHVIEQLMSVKKQLSVIAIAGIYRTGKSYLLTRIAGQYKGFPLGSSIQSKTKGIWAWCVDHPVHAGQALLLLDTEGLGDIRKGDQNHDNQIFTLATLLSSTLIYNTFGAFDDDALNKLNFITEMSKNIKTADVSLSVTSDADFDVYFPEFILTLRDFTLDLEVDGEEISPDGYLEYCLKAQEGDSAEIQRFNEPRLCIRKYFKKRKCFVFGWPASRSKLKTLEDLTDADLNPDFVEDTNLFLSYVHNQTVPMKLKNGTPVTGRMFCNLARSYIDAIRKGAVPCIQSALRSMAMIENESAVDQALSIYCSEMSANIKLPTETEQELRDIHIRSKGAAFDHFLRHRVLDDDDTYKLKLDNRVKAEYEKIVSINEEKSKEKCEDVLRNLHATISANINNGVYAVPGGYELYNKDRDVLKRKYDNVQGLGVMKNEAYVAYVHYMKNESEAVLKSDQTITEKEKVLHLERESKKRAEEREAMVQKKMQEAYKEMVDMKSQHDKEFEKLREVHTQELANERSRLDDITEKRMQELSRVQSENLRQVQDRYEKELDRLQESQRQRDDDMKESMERMNDQLQQLTDDNREKEKRLTKLQTELEYEKKLRAEQEKISDPNLSSLVPLASSLLPNVLGLVQDATELVGSGLGSSKKRKTDS